MINCSSSIDHSFCSFILPCCDKPTETFLNNTEIVSQYCKKVWYFLDNDNNNDSDNIKPPPHTHTQESSGSSECNKSRPEVSVSFRFSPESDGSNATVDRSI